MLDSATNAVLYHNSLGTIVLLTGMGAVGFISLSLWNLVKMIKSGRQKGSFCND